ncbi:MAG: ABC transporter substrate-binding protein [Nitrospirae bacterium]|nr:ABC transporter substrate-binding protein [Nitrospirota bacterium]
MIRFCIFLASLFLLSCGSSSRIDGFVYYRINANPTTLDPALIVDVTGASIAAKLFNGLVKLDENLNIVPDIAERWQISNDGLRYTFFLRKDVRFKNGRIANAHDFKFSYERVLHPDSKSPVTWVFDKVYGAAEFRNDRVKEVAGFRVIDEHTFEIRLNSVFSPFLNILTTTTAYVVPKEEVSRWGPDFSSNPSGTGPFYLKEWKQNAEVKLVKNPNYFEDTAKINGIVYKIIPEDLTAITDFELGNLDVISLPASAYSKFRDDAKWEKEILTMNAPNTYYLGLNCSKPPFDNAALRRAVGLAVDRKKILETFYEKRGRLALGPVADIIRAWTVAPDANDFSYKPEEASKIVKKLYPQGLSAKMYITADQDVVDLAEIIQSYLEKSGIKVTIKQLEWSAYKQAINSGEPDIFWLSWWADYPDPENFLFPLFHSANLGPAGNRTRYVNKSVDSLIEKGQKAVNVQQRNAFYKQAEDIIISEAPWIPFWHKTDFLIKQPHIKNYKAYPIHTMDKGLGITIETR